MRGDWGGRWGGGVKHSGGGDHWKGDDWCGGGIQL